MSRVDERIEAISYMSPRYYSQSDAQYAALERQERALTGAQGQTEKMLSLFARSKGLGQSLRALNKFLTAIMEGRIARGQEQFSQFLIDLVHSSSQSCPI